MRSNSLELCNDPLDLLERQIYQSFLSWISFFVPDKIRYFKYQVACF